MPFVGYGRAVHDPIRAIYDFVDNYEEMRLTKYSEILEPLEIRDKIQQIIEKMKKGLVFLKADIRGKYLIEYIPAENACVPIEAYGYMDVNCFWVSGSCKEHGYAIDVLDKCIEDAKQKGKAQNAPFAWDDFALFYKSD